MDQKGIHVFYSGVVQGVGFRFSVAALARQHYLKGWVKNCPDGRVELAVTGSPESVDHFLEDVRETFKRNLVDIGIEPLTEAGDYSDFQICF